MSSPESPTPNLTAELPKLIRAVQMQSAATLAAAIISQMQRPVSIKEALDIVSHSRFAMYPAKGNPAYQEWEKTQEQTLSQVVT